MFEMDPEEYRQIKNELEEERKRVIGYYNSPNHFYSEEVYNITQRIIFFKSLLTENKTIKLNILF